MRVFRIANESLTIKIVVAVTVPVVTLLGIFTYLHLASEEKEMLQQSIQGARLLTRTIVSSLKQSMLEGRGSKVKRMVSAYTGIDDVDRVEIIDPNHEKVWMSSNASRIGARVTSDWQEISALRNRLSTQLLKEEQVVSVRTVVPNEQRCHRCHGPFKKVNGVIEVRIKVNGMMEGVATIRRRMVWFTGWLGLAITGTVIALVSLLIHRPIHRLVEGMDKVKRGDLQTKVAIPGEDELAQLGENFNAMVAQLATAADEHERLRWWLERRVEKLSTLEQIATGIAHEFKSPLAGIKAAIEIFRDGLEHEDMRRDILEEVIAHIAKLDESVRNFLRFAKPSPPMVRPTDINVVMESVLMLIDKHGLKRRAAIVRDCAESLPRVSIDPDQMRQVFLNIGMNALEALDGVGSEVRFKTCLAADGRKVVVDIRDNGRGISPSDQERIFEPYFTTKSDGTGLGLAIAQRLVEENGGRIFVESQVGKGATFRVELLAIDTKP